MPVPVLVSHSLVSPPHPSIQPRGVFHPSRRPLQCVRHQQRRPQRLFNCLRLRCLLRLLAQRQHPSSFPRLRCHHRHGTPRPRFLWLPPQWHLRLHHHLRLPLPGRLLRHLLQPPGHRPQAVLLQRHPKPAFPQPRCLLEPRVRPHLHASRLVPPRLHWPLAVLRWPRRVQQAAERHPLQQVARRPPCPKRPSSFSLALSPWHAQAWVLLRALQPSVQLRLIPSNFTRRRILRLA